MPRRRGGRVEFRRGAVPLSNRPAGNCCMSAHALRSVTTAYGVASFALQVLHSVFITFFTPLYFCVHKISSSSFYWGQLVYMVWNSVNDPVIGGLSDACTGASTPAGRRIPALRYCGPLCALAFALLWMPIGCFWGDCAAVPGDRVVFVFFVACTFVYDGLFTYLSLAHSALLADLTLQHSARAAFTRSQALFSAAAAVCGVVIAASLWHPKDLRSFRRWTHILALVACAAFVWAAREIERYAQSAAVMAATDAESTAPHSPQSHMVVHVQPAASTPAPATTPSFSSPTDTKPSSGWRAVWRTCREIILLPSFGWFVLMNCAQQFLCSFNNSFWIIFLDVFYGAWLLPVWRALLVAAAFVLPHLNTVACVPLIERLGTYRVVRLLFHARAMGAILTALVLGVVLGPTLLAGSAAWMAHAYGHHDSNVNGGRGSGGSGSAEIAAQVDSVSHSAAHLPPIALIVVGAFLVFNRVSTEAVCRLMNLCVADIVDEDQWQHRRRLTLSASVFGLQALLTKPFTSLAPMFGWWVLDRAGCKPASLLPAASPPRDSIALTAAPESATEASLASRLLAQFVDALAFDVSAPESASAADAAGAAVELPRLAPALVWASVALLVLVPLALLGCQLVVWQRYPLHGARLRSIKMALEPSATHESEISVEDADDGPGRVSGSSDPGCQELYGLRHGVTLQQHGGEGGGEEGRMFKEV